MADEVTPHRISCDDDTNVLEYSAPLSRVPRGSAPLPHVLSGSAPLPRKCQRLFSNHRMEIVGTSSTDDQQIMDQSLEVSVDINEIATSLRDHLKNKKVFSRACCIYRVPARLRRLNEEAYTPRVVSIGPLHHGKENLKAMEDHKIMYLQQFIELRKVSVEELINVVKDNESKLLDCYEETIDLSSEDFITMILLDAVFVIMVLLRCSPAKTESHESGSADQIFFPPFKVVDVVFDMCLLENQLPFFILKKLFELSNVAVDPKNCTVIELSNVAADPKNCTVIELTSKFLHKIMEELVNENNCKKINSEVLHFVDFIRECQQPTGRRSEEKKTAIVSAPPATKPILSAPPATKPILSAPPATQLHQSGVKFKHPVRNSLFDVSFNEGTLEIPQLTINDNTETLFRNLQAFEQCHYMSEGMFVNDYINFISCLVRAPNDVDVLAREKNLKIMLNSNEAVSKLLYNLDKQNVVSENSFLWDVCKRLESHCKERRHEWKATLKQVYFNNPWTAISVVAAAFLLVLTVTQTVCSILQL